MLTFKKTLIAGFLAAGITVLAAADHAQAAGRGLLRGGRSGGIGKVISRGGGSSRTIGRLGGGSRTSGIGKMIGGGSRTPQIGNVGRFVRDRTNFVKRLRKATRGGIGSPGKGHSIKDVVKKGLRQNLHLGGGHGKHGKHGKHSHHKHGHWHFVGKHGWGFGYCKPHYSYTFGCWKPYVHYCDVYYNPYCVTPGFLPDPCLIGYDYSQPIGANGQTTEAGMQALDAAAQAFYEGDLDAALRLVDQAAELMPNNTDVHQFRSLILFAMKKYRPAAAAAHAALAAGPGWNWEQLRSFFPSAEIYTAELRELEAAHRSNPDDVPTRFLLAYHYLMLDHEDAAARHLAHIVEMEPKDGLSKQLLQSLGGRPRSQAQPGNETGPPAEPPPTDEPAEPQLPGGAPDEPIDNAGTEPIQPGPVMPEPPAARELGVWKAKNEEGVEVELTLKADGAFQWKVTAEGRSMTFAGNYTLQDGLLSLTRSTDGQKLEGTVEFQNDRTFVLTMKGAPENDPGLTFVK